MQHVEAILKKKPDLNIKNLDDETPLEYVKNRLQCRPLGTNDRENLEKIIKLLEQYQANRALLGNIVAES